MAHKFIRIQDRDNVVVALEDLSAGDLLHIKDREVNIEVKTAEAVPRGHKIALEDINKGAPVIKYGYPIGYALKQIKKGSWVHTHNLETALRGTENYTYSGSRENNEILNTVNSEEIPVFEGYHRENGEWGIRNEIWIINTVGCITRITEKIAKLAQKKYRTEIASDSIDGIFDFPHPLGCSQLGDDLENTQKILAGLARHPNAGGVLVAGLGCEDNQIDDFKKYLGDYNPRRIKFISFQKEKDEVSASLDRIEELVDYAARFSRQETPVSHLKIGLKCGGSDSLSGITANPLLGRISDKLISYGGTSVLGEVPEMFGAEEILLKRAENREVFFKIADLINDFKEFFLNNGQKISENPSPGNIEGGLSTLEEKSLGNIEKGGTGIIRGVNGYGEPVDKAGLQLLETPGNDLVSTTALSAAGAHMVLFTTGRGTPFGGPVPTVKIATNSQLAEHKENWIDFDAGQLVNAGSMDELGADFFALLMKIASGKQQTQNEINDFREIAIFKKGVTL